MMRNTTKKDLPKLIYLNIRVKNVKRREGWRRKRKIRGERVCWLMRGTRGGGLAKKRNHHLKAKSKSETIDLTISAESSCLIW